MFARRMFTQARWLQAALGLWLVAVVAVSIRVARHPGSHSAFRGVRIAGASWLQQAELYGSTTGFLYSPLIAALHAPFAMLSASVAEVLWRLLIGVSVPLALWYHARGLFRFSLSQFAFLFLMTLPLTLNTLNNGQSNVVLVLLLLVATTAAQQARWWLCAACASFAIYWKLYPIAFALLLIIVFPKELPLRVLCCVVVLFLLPFLLQHTSYVRHEYREWIGNLLSDQRREIGYYGKNRDFYLLLRVAGIPISTSWWAVLQLLAGLGAACVLFAAKLRRMPRETLLFSAMSLSIAWMLLFGPATEGVTYVLAAIPCAYLLMFGWASGAAAPLPIGSALAYIGFIIAEVVNSWLGIKRNIHLVHAVQPFVAVVFCATLLYWLQRDNAAARAESHDGSG